MRIFTKLIAFAAIALFFAACAAYKSGESVIPKDATPPPDYKPAFITSVKDFDPNNLDKPELSVSFVDSKQFDSTTKVYLHLIDNKKEYVKGASLRNNLKYWCNVYVTFDGKREPIKNFKVSELIDGGGRKNAIALVMDHSGSMGNDRAIAVQNAVAKLIDKKRDQDGFSLIRYDHRINTEMPLSNSKRQLADGHKINGLLGYNGMTAIVDAAKQGAREITGKGYDNNVVMIFTDGFDNSSKLKKEDLISFSLENNVKIFGVDFGANINPDYVKDIAENTGGFYRRIYSTNEFDLLFDDMYFRLNNAYVLDIETEFYGKHFLEVEICLPKETIAATYTFDNTPDIGQVSLLNVYFDFNKSSIKNESKKAVNKLLRLMKSFPNMEVELRGHTDSLNRTGDANYNIKLSQERADAVKQELIKNGIEASRIKSVGFGERKPIADNSTDEGRRKNRRTEFIILRK